MKDISHHLKYVQKKVLRSAKKENPHRRNPFKSEEILDIRRPKKILNKKKAA